MRFLVAYDGTDGANAALTAAANLAKSSGSEMVVLHVLNPLIDAASVVAPTTHDAIATVAAESRANIEAQLKTIGATADVRVELATRGEDDWEHIVHVAQDIQAELIAIGSRTASTDGPRIHSNGAAQNWRLSPTVTLRIMPSWLAVTQQLADWFVRKFPMP